MSDLSWYALQIKPRFEKHVASLLSSKGYEQYLPLYSPAKRWKNGQKKMVALFPGYVFCRFDAADRLPVLTTPGVYGIVTCSGQPDPVDERELDSIRTLLSAGAQVTECEYLPAGQRVRIHSGPLRGVEGRVVMNKQWRIVVSITLLQRSVSAEIDRDCIELIATSGLDLGAETAAQKGARRR